jgi:hypothetical protein
MRVVYTLVVINMQLAFSCVPETFQAIEGSLSEARLGRYLGDSRNDRQYALRLYVWNASLCEAFYLPSQVAEVAIRNTIHKALFDKHGPDWFDRGSFLCTLPDRLRSELKDVIRQERRQYGAAMNVNHIVSGLSFGFWQHLLTKNYENVFWPNYFPSSFPHKPKKITRQDLWDKVDRLRTFRNRLAHHKPIFDRFPKLENQNLLELLSWVCLETRWFVETTSRVDQAISLKPGY